MGNSVWQTRWTAIVNRLRIVAGEPDERSLIAALSLATQPQVLAFVNAHAMNCGAADSEFFEALVSADVLLRDGSGMAMLYRHLRLDAGKNMNGTDLIPRLLAAFRGRNVAFWGTREPHLALAAARSEREFGVHIVSRQDGFQEADHYLKLARDSSLDLIVLGMGMPKQEQLAQAIRMQGHGTPLIVCGGAILDFLGGKVERAPMIMRNAGLEWLYRLVREPRRLFQRYVVGNPAFVLRLMRWTLQKPL
jgi:N-acetylglucosaminyldiphosphoundecaprenol N-acetyl-beta-D-mannosaminyltransferase